MKKYLLVATITLGAVINANYAFFQSMNGTNCPQKELVKTYTEFTDSIARFFANLKTTTDAENFAGFVEALPTDSIEAFNVYGTRSAGLKDSMNALIDSLNNNLNLLRTAIDPYNLMSVAVFFDTLSSKISCFLADTTINSVVYLVEQCYGTGASTNRLVGGSGPCEDALRTNLISARQAYNTAIASCLMGATCPGWWRVACIAGCIIYENSSYNEAKAGYYYAYRFCLGLSCDIPPFY